ncbi:MAG TPA: RNA polymerase sigma factor, partial [Sphingopyxis sp.]|nr:RNA polymerase sigma factor [Sphingopyxis sp.]
ARNVLISRYRSQAARSAFLHDEFEESLEIADQLSPERIAIGQQEYLRVVEAISKLPPRAREAFQLHRFENLTYQAIAQRMGISKESVKELMHRAIVRLAEAMEADA